jgi:hypothetical protein
MSTKIRGLYHPNLMRLKGLLHTVQPSVQFYYTPDYDLYFTHYSYEDNDQTYSGERNRFYSVNSISSTPREKRDLSYSLTNLLSVKWAGEEKEEKIKLINLRMSGTYDFLAEGRGFSDIRLSYGLTPSSATSFSLNTLWDPYNKEWGTISTNTRITLSGQGAEDEAETYIKTLMEEEEETSSEKEELFGRDNFYESEAAATRRRPWRISGSWSWSKSPDGKEDSKIHGSANFNLTKNWRLNVNAGYDIMEGEFTNQSINVIRDLHCWELVFDWHRYRDIWNYKLLIRIKKIPDIKIERREQFYPYY